MLADVRVGVNRRHRDLAGGCRFHLQERTSRDHRGMSDWCQYLTCQMRLLTLQSGLSQIHLPSPSSLDTPSNEPRIIKVLSANGRFPCKSSNAPGSGKSMQTLNLSNLIATCNKLLHFGNWAYLKLACAAGNITSRG